MDSEDFAALQSGLREAVQDIKARDASWAKAVRAKTGLSQPEFARTYGLQVRTLQNWEQGRPVDGAAQTLLRLIERDPQGISRMLNG